LKPTRPRSEFRSGITVLGFPSHPDSRQKGGTSLGLAIVKQIVDRLGGRVDFEPAPGGGTIFKVTLPQAAQPRPAQAAGDAADPFAEESRQEAPVPARHAS